MKFGLLCFHLPPSKTPHGAIIQRLLRGVDPERYFLISATDYGSAEELASPDRLPARYYRLPPPFQFKRGYQFGLGTLRTRVNIWLTLFSRTRAIARILRKERCGALVVCTGGHSVLDFPAAYLACRMTGVAFHAYLLDRYLNMVQYALGKSVIRRFEPLVMQGAASVIAPNEFLADEIRARYGVTPVVLHNPCDIPDPGPSVPATASPGKVPGRAIRIVYTGTVADLYIDALRNLAMALDLLGRDDVQLDMYTASPREYCEAQGITGRVVYHAPVALSEIAEVQRQADVLFLPLAFHSDHADHLRTSAPGKLGEYLAARRPILVHVPPGCFTAWYFREHECGVVVDEDSPAALMAGLMRLLSDPAYCQVLGARAGERARIDFAQPEIQRTFLELLGVPS